MSDGASRSPDLTVFVVILRYFLCSALLNNSAEAVHSLTVETTLAGANPTGSTKDVLLLSLPKAGHYSLPLCACTGLRYAAMQGSTCSLGLTVESTDFCFVPRSYCVTAEPTEELNEASLLQSANWDEIRESANFFESYLPKAAIPSCRCWTLGDVMVAPCGLPVHQQNTAAKNTFPPTYISVENSGAVDTESMSKTLLAQEEYLEHQSNLKSHVSAPVKPPGPVLHARLFHNFVHPAGLPQLDTKWARRLATERVIAGSRFNSGGAAAYSWNGPCHKSCQSCQEPGRDRCRACPNQLPYPYLPPKPRRLSSSTDSLRLDIIDPQFPEVQYYALVAAHRDGSGYCIPLEFGDDSDEATELECVSPGLGTVANSGAPWWPFGGTLSSRKASHCHPTCSVCRADCCRGKPDNCLACKGSRHVFHPLYRDGTGRCLDLRRSDEELPMTGLQQQSVIEESLGVQETTKTTSNEEDTNGFTALLQAIVSVASSVPAARRTGDPKVAASLEKGPTRKGPSFLPRRSLCESLPRKIGDMPIRAWSQLMFVHADNNLEESALLDLEEMLHPWRGEIVKRHARAALRGRGTPPLPVGGSALSGLTSQEALEDLYLVVLIDRSSQKSSTDMGTVHACPELEYSILGEGVKQLPGTSEVELNAQMAFELLRVHLQDGRREWLLLRSLGEVDMNDPGVLGTAVTRFLDIFPSRHYAVILWNHGSAWAGFGDDESNPNNQPMSIHDIAVGLKTGISRSKLGKVDRSFRLSLLGFDACLMGSYDVLEALAPLTHFFLASEENEPGHGWNYRSMDPTSLIRKPPPPYRTATAFEYGTRFVTSYGLHPPSSNALTLALIEVRAFNEFKKKFEELLEGLYSCGGSNITRRVRRALSQTFSIRGCQMLGLCSCYDLNDFLASLLQQFASDEHDMGRITLQSRRQDNVAPWALDDLKKPTNPLITQNRLLQQWTQQVHTVNALGAAQRALTDKVVAARVLFRKMIVAEVGSREPGRYGGLSIYFPDPNMAVNCKAHRNAGSWARRYTSTIRTKFSSFVTSVLSNRKGSVCYSPWGGSGVIGRDGASPLPHHAAEAPQWFGVLCSRVLKPLPEKDSLATIGISAVVPATVVSAMMFRGFAASALKGNHPDIIITSTAQATMTDAEVKTSSVPLNFGEVPIDVQRVNSGSEDASGKNGLHARREEAEEVAALREFTVVQGWWNTHVWILKQQLDFDDVLKDPRPQRQRRGSSGSVEAVVVAMQEGSESSRLGQGRATTFSFPFLFFKDALDAECLKDTVLHTETLDRPERVQTGLATILTADGHTGKRQTGTSGFERRALQGLRYFSTESPDSEETLGRRRVLSKLVLPLGMPSTNNGGIGIPDSLPQKPEITLETTAKTASNSRKPESGYVSTERSHDSLEYLNLRHLSSKRVGSPSWLIHERLGREPQRREENKRQCGARAFLLASWDEGQAASSELALYVVENEQTTEWPRSRGGLLVPIEHRLRRMALPYDDTEGGSSIPRKVKGDGESQKHGKRGAAGIEKAQQQNASHIISKKLSALSSGKGTGFSGPSPSEETGTNGVNFGGEQSREIPPENVTAVVLEESVGDVTFFWNVESDVGKLFLQPASISTILRDHRAKSRFANGQEQRSVVGFILQDILDQRAVAASSVPLVEPKALAHQSIWESVAHSLFFGDFMSSTTETSSIFSSPSGCQSHWLGDGICDELCDTGIYGFDRGDCPHRNPAAEQLLEQQEPKGACVGNRCSQIALCEAYDDPTDGRGIRMPKEHPKEKMGVRGARREEAETITMKPSSQESPLVATIWEGPRGRYVCRCPKGYTGDGTTCEDINECEVFAGAVCHSKAVCINTKGSYRCICKPGYTGDGRDVCMLSNHNHSPPERLCVDQNNRPLCPPSLHCLDDGSCGCREGYTMESGGCVDVDECSNGLASCAPPSVATCVNTSGGYFCSCVDGYEGDGRQCVASPSTAEAEISIAMDYQKTIAAAGGKDMLKEALIDAILQAIPALGDRKRIEVHNMCEGSINAAIRIHPPTGDGPSYLDGSDNLRQLTAAEVLLALQEQLAEPLSSLRTGPFGEYASYTTIERYTFFDRSAAKQKFELLAFLTDWLPDWLKDAIPRELIAAVELLLLLICVTAVAMGIRRAIKRSARREAAIVALRRPF